MTRSIQAVRTAIRTFMICLMIGLGVVLSSMIIVGYINDVRECRERGGRLPFLGWCVDYEGDIDGVMPAKRSPVGLYIVYYKEGLLSGSIGPLPFSRFECERRVAERRPEIKDKSFTLQCEWRETRPLVLGK